MDSETQKTKKFEISQISEKCPSREENQDSLKIFSDSNPIVEYHDKGYIFSVADGVTTSKNPKMAGEIATDYLLNFYKTCCCTGSIEKLILDANKKIIEIEGATTFSVAHLHKNKLNIYHAGDSAIYLCSIDDDLGMYVERLTEDQSEGNAVTNCLGIPDLKIQKENRLVKENDYILLGSDGAVQDLDERTILSIIKKKKNTQSICEEIFKYKTDDDATLAVVKFLNLE